MRTEKQKQNLKPVRKREDAPFAKNPELAKAAQKKSTESKLRKKFFKEEIENQIGDSIRNIITAAIKRAEKGDITADIFLRDTIGEKPTDKSEVDLSGGIDTGAPVVLKIGIDGKKIKTRWDKRIES
jgi:hypothetical protein